MNIFDVNSFSRKVFPESTPLLPKQGVGYTFAKDLLLSTPSSNQGAVFIGSADRQTFPLNTGGAKVRLSSLLNLQSSASRYDLRNIYFTGTSLDKLEIFLIGPENQITIPSPYAWSVDDVPDVEMAWDAQQSELAAVGAGITDWYDLSGNNLTLEDVGIAARRPLYIHTGLNSKPTLEFTNTAPQYLQLPVSATISPGTPWSMYAVLKPQNFSFPYWYGGFGVGEIRATFVRALYVVPSASTTFARSVTVDEPIAITMVSDGTVSGTSCWVNNVSVALSASSGTNIGFSLIELGKNGGFQGNHRISHLSAASSAHDSSTRQALTLALMSDYGIS